MKNEIQNDTHLIGYGLKNNALIHISEVESGLDCGCICPQCNQPLIARKGTKNEHHFAHHNSDACAGAYETTLHRLAKQIIAQYKKVTLPVLEIEVCMEDIGEQAHRKISRTYGYKASFDAIEIEKTATDFIPDITATNFYSTLFIEIVVTHGVDETKLAKVEKYGVNMMSINLSQMHSLLTLKPDEIEQAVLHEAPREWIYAENSALTKQQLYQDLENEITEIDRRIKSNVLNNLTTFEIEELKSVQSNLSKPSGDEYILLGYKSGYGYSLKKDSNFDFSKLHVAKPLKPNTYSINYRERGIGGYETTTLDFPEDLLPLLKTMEFPCVAIIAVENLYQGTKSPKLIARAIYTA